MDLLYYILACIFFFFPAYMANAAPPLIANKTKLWEKLARPIDGGRKIRSSPILGNHKTWRGLVAEIIVCTGYYQIFFLVYDYFDFNFYEVIGFDPYILNNLAFGLLLSAGIVFGDLLFAFIKRRLKLRPGQAFMPFDQINYVIGSFIVLQGIYHFEIQFWIILTIVTFFMHVLFNRIGYNLGLHKAKW